MFNTKCFLALTFWFFFVGGSSDDLPITKQQILEVAEGLGNDWKKLAVELNFLDDMIAYFDSENQDITQKALKMLTVWFVSRITILCLMYQMKILFML